MSITVTITAACEDHPKYKGVRRPTVKGGCWGCADLYALRRPETEFMFEGTIQKVEVKNNG